MKAIMVQGLRTTGQHAEVRCGAYSGAVARVVSAYVILGGVSRSPPRSDARLAVVIT
jgi:hypothetical protein